MSSSPSPSISRPHALIVDLHIHSHYSQATSKQMNTEDLYRWAKIKGIDVLGTGDFTHPSYFAELTEKLVLRENGLYQLREDLAEIHDAKLPESVRGREVWFVPSVEIATVYRRHGRGRRMHNLVMAPTLEVAGRLNARLAEIGNLQADGRPILGLDSAKLFEMVLESDPLSLYIPAHIWTPWFALFGEKSGFDSLKEAYGDLWREIRAVETGLSSDPWMNWRVDELRDVTLVSNSDAHSVPKLGREANLVRLPGEELSWMALREAIVEGDERFVGTIEFFPEEGRYHFDGHRKCGVRMTPVETAAAGGLCPVCGRKVTVGTQNRVGALADQPADFRPGSDMDETAPRARKHVEYIIPLMEMLREIAGVKSIGAKSVVVPYDRMIAALGDEFSVLRTVDIGQVREAGFPEMAVSIEKMRAGDVSIEPGYDGEYGEISVFEKSREKLSA